MNLLLDTHALLWFTAGDARMGAEARRVIEDSETISYISMASWWEIAIKCSLGKLTLYEPLALFMSRRADEGFRFLAIDARHIVPLIDMPFHHRDPFDRLIICQAMSENMPICTYDPGFSRYGVRVIW